mgnify:FL=1
MPNFDSEYEKYPFWFCDNCREAIARNNERDVIYDFNLHKYLMGKPLEVDAKEEARLSKLA